LYEREKQKEKKKVTRVQDRDREDVDKRGGFDEFFNESQSCRGKSEAVEMLLTLEDLFLLLSSSGCL